MSQDTFLAKIRREMERYFEKQSESGDRGVARRARLARASLVNFWDAVNLEVSGARSKDDEIDVLVDATNVLASGAHFLCDHLVKLGATRAAAFEAVTKTIADNMVRIENARLAQGRTVEFLEPNGEPDFDFRTMMRGEGR